MRSSTRLFPLVTILALALGACSSDEPAAPDDAPDAAEAPAAEATDDASQDAPATDDEAPDDTPAPAAAVGTVEVDGTSYGISEVLRCEPFDDGVVDRELELQGFGEAPDGTRVQIDVYVEELSGMPFDDVSWSGPEGVYGSPEDAEVDFTGDNVTGTAVLHQAMGDGTTVTVSFDLPVPADLFACR